MASEEEGSPLIQPRGGSHEPMLGVMDTLNQLGDPHHPPYLYLLTFSNHKITRVKKGEIISTFLFNNC